VKNMKFGSKGQGAMEYLMTYGWAILVVMIVGVVLWQLGVFGGAGGGVNRCTGFTKIKCFDNSVQGLASTGLIQATFMNGAMTGVNVTVSNATGSCDSASFNDTTLSAGQETVVTFGTALVPCTGATADGSFSVDVTIAYTETVAGRPLSHTDTGRITGTWE
jgi:hypothetical protein